MNCDCVVRFETPTISFEPNTNVNQNNSLYNSNSINCRVKIMIGICFVCRVEFVKLLLYTQLFVSYSLYHTSALAVEP
jgi:hypothetical protein